MQERHDIVEAFSELSPQYEKVVDRELTTFWGWSYEEFLREMLSQVRIEAGDRVLDIATGTGAIPLSLLARADGQGRFVGLDITPAALEVAREKVRARGAASRIDLVCGTALSMPYRDASFSVVLCGLATHHMDVERMLSEMKRVIEPAGRLTIADVGASNLWRIPLVKTALRLAAYLYFLFKDGAARARIESSAVANVRTAPEWRTLAEKYGFADITIKELQTRRIWSPSPLLIRAVFPHE